jgi:hypothetical protein
MSSKPAEIPTTASQTNVSSTATIEAKTLKTSTVSIIGTLEPLETEDFPNSLMSGTTMSSRPTISMNTTAKETPKQDIPAEKKDTSNKPQVLDMDKTSTRMEGGSLGSRSLNDDIPAENKDTSNKPQVLDMDKTSTMMEEGSLGSRGLKDDIPDSQLVANKNPQDVSLSSGNPITVPTTSTSVPVTDITEIPEENTEENTNTVESVSATQNESVFPPASVQEPLNTNTTAKPDDTHNNVDTPSTTLISEFQNPVSPIEASENNLPQKTEPSAINNPINDRIVTQSGDDTSKDLLQDPNKEEDTPLEGNDLFIKEKLTQTLQPGNMPQNGSVLPQENKMTESTFVQQESVPNSPSITTKTPDRNDQAGQVPNNAVDEVKIPQEGSPIEPELDDSSPQFENVEDHHDLHSGLKSDSVVEETPTETVNELTSSREDVSPSTEKTRLRPFLENIFLEKFLEKFEKKNRNSN